MKIIQGIAAILSCVAVSAFAPMNAVAQTPQPARKKLIETGWDMPDTATLRANLKQMEQTPFDGILIDAVGKDDAGKDITMRTAFSATPWKREWFQNCVDDLKAIHSTKLTDNFIRVYANPGSVDWFDDAGWKQIAEHMRIAAWIAKEGNAKGLLLDPEAYSKPRYQFDYRAQAQREKHTFEQYQSKARQRGREIIRAVAEVDPNLTFFTFFMNSVNAAAIKSNNPHRALQIYNYSLYPSFINGWLDAAPPSMTFVEGSESQGYAANDELDFLRTANLIRNTSLKLVAPENWQKYHAQVQLSFGIYLDPYVNAPNAVWYIDPKGVSPTERLRINLSHAAKTADKYVWIYGEKYRWWTTKHSAVNPESWEEKLPGISEALLDSVYPERALDQFITSEQQRQNTQNLARNSTFTAGAAPVKTPQDDMPSDWKINGAPPEWITWKSASSEGNFGLDSAVSRTADGSGAGRIDRMNDGCLIQRIDVKPGETYALRVWNRQAGQGNAWVSVRWLNANMKWTNRGSNVSLFGENSADENGWSKIQGKITVPPDTAKMAVLLFVGGQKTAQDIAWFDDISVYKMSD